MTKGLAGSLTVFVLCVVVFMILYAFVDAPRNEARFKALEARIEQLAEICGALSDKKEATDELR